MLRKRIGSKLTINLPKLPDVQPPPPAPKPTAEDPGKTISAFYRGDVTEESRFCVYSRGLGSVRNQIATNASLERLSDMVSELQGKHLCVNIRHDGRWVDFDPKQLLRLLSERSVLVG